MYLAAASRIQRRQKNIFLFTFLIVPMVLLISFLFYPMLKLVQVSFTNWDGMSKAVKWVGLNNYRQIFTDSPDVWKSLKNNGLYLFIHLFFIPMEIWVAYLLNRGLKNVQVFKSLILLPYIINGVAVSYMFSNIFMPQMGALDMTLDFLGLGNLKQGWLGDPAWVNFTLVFVSLWRFSGFHVILFLAAMASIPSELFESASMDGAGPFKIFLHIVLPNIAMTIEIVLFLNVRGALQVFDIPFVMTNGGPGFASSTFTFFTMKTAFDFNSFGLASAMAIILFVMIVVIAKMQDRILHGRSPS